MRYFGAGIIGSLVVTLLSPVAASASSGCDIYSVGNGTEQNPYQVSTAMQLDAVDACEAGTDKYFLQASDIFLDERTIRITQLNGGYDGGGHKIVGLDVRDVTISSDGKTASGLFPKLNSARLSNLTLVEPVIDRASHTGAFFGVATDSQLSNLKVIGGQISPILNTPDNPHAIFGGGIGGLMVGGELSNLSATGTYFNTALSTSVTQQDRNNNDNSIGGLIGRVEINQTATFENLYASTDMFVYAPQSAQVAGMFGSVIFNAPVTLEISNFALLSEIRHEQTVSVIAGSSAGVIGRLENNSGASTSSNIFPKVKLVDGSALSELRLDRIGGTVHASSTIGVSEVDVEIDSVLTDVTGLDTLSSESFSAAPKVSVSNRLVDFYVRSDNPNLVTTGATVVSDWSQPLAFPVSSVGATEGWVRDSRLTDIPITVEALISGGLGTLYVVNGGDGRAVKNSRLDITATDLGFSRIGYDFVGWNTLPDGSGGAYPGGAQIFDVPGVLYAQWSEADELSNPWKIEKHSELGPGGAGISLESEILVGGETGYAVTDQKEVIEISSAGVSNAELQYNQDLLSLVSTKHAVLNNNLVLEAETENGAGIFGFDVQSGSVSRLFADSYAAGIGISSIVSDDQLVWATVNKTKYTSGYADADFLVWEPSFGEDGAITATTDRSILGTPVAANGKVFFSANNDSGQRILYSLDSAGSQQSYVLQLALDNGVNPAVRQLVGLGNKVYFLADYASGKTGLWELAAGATQPTKLFDEEAFHDWVDFEPTGLSVSGGYLRVLAEDRIFDEIYYLSNGQLFLEENFNPVTGSVSYKGMTIMPGNPQVGFNDYYGGHLLELTEHGLRHISLPTPGVNSSEEDFSPEALAVIGDWIYFSATGMGDGREIWRAGYFPVDTPSDYQVSDVTESFGDFDALNLLGTLQGEMYFWASKNGSNGIYQLRNGEVTQFSNLSNDIQLNTYGSVQVGDFLAFTAYWTKNGVAGSSLYIIQNGQIFDLFESTGTDLGTDFHYFIGELVAGDKLYVATEHGADYRTKIWSFDGANLNLFFEASYDDEIQNVGAEYDDKLYVQGENANGRRILSYIENGSLTQVRDSDGRDLSLFGNYIADFVTVGDVMFYDSPASSDGDQVFTWNGEQSAQKTYLSASGRGELFEYRGGVVADFSAGSDTSQWWWVPRDSYPQFVLGSISDSSAFRPEASMRQWRDDLFVHFTSDIGSQPMLFTDSGMKLLGNPAGQLAAGRVTSSVVFDNNLYFSQQTESGEVRVTKVVGPIVEQISAPGLSAPAPFVGAIVDSAELIDNELLLGGSNLDLIEGLELGGQTFRGEIRGENYVSDITGLVVGDYQLSYKTSGSVVSTDFIISVADISLQSTESAFWTKRISDTEIKLYAKNIIGIGKAQFFHNGNEIAWVRAESDADPKLRTANGSSYLVRTRELVSGFNVFEIYLDGERVERRVQSY